MLKQRVITAIFLAAVLFVALWLLSPFQLSVFFGGILLLASWEWSNLAGLESMLSRCVYVVLVLALLLAAGGYLGLPQAVDFRVVETVCRSALLWWLVALVLVKTYPQNIAFWQSSLVRSLFGLFVLLPPWVAIVFLLYLPKGYWYLLLVVGIVVAADVGAYFCGRYFGKHKLAPGVSPGKTWEGVLGGMLANLLIMCLLVMLLDMPVTTGWLFLLVMLPAALSVVGDLLESMMKRHRGVKDSGRILPGHGGLLDRIDSLTVAIPVFVLVAGYSGVFA